MAKRGVSPVTGRGGFWQVPPLSVWFLCGVSALIFWVSMGTWWEGMHYHSRPLTVQEYRIVTKALGTWYKLVPDSDGVSQLWKLLRAGSIRALQKGWWWRDSERITIGYTDERGRILLNPELCFSAYHSLASSFEVYDCDVVRTMSTLYHEWQHRNYRVGERVALQREQEFITRCLERCSRQGYGSLEKDLREWRFILTAGGTTCPLK